MNSIILILSLAGGTTGLAMRAIEPMLPVFAEEFGVSIPAASNVITVFAVAYAVGQFIHGPLGDRYGKLRIVTLTVLLTSGAMLGCALAGTLFSLALWRAATGVVSSAPFVLSMAYIGDTVALDKRQSVIAHYVVGNVLGHAFGPVLAGVMTDAVGWRATFLVLAALFLAVGIALLITTRSHWQDETRLTGTFNPVARYLEVLKLSGARMIAVSAIAEAFFFFGAFAFVAALLKLRFDLSYTIIGVALAGFGVGGLLFNISIRWILKRITSRTMVLVGGILCGLSFLAIALAPVWQPVIPCMIGVGVGFYMMHNVLQTRGTEAAPDARGIGVSLFGVAWTLGMGLGVAVMGAGVSVFGIEPMLICYSLGLVLFGAWMRLNFHRLP
jgi:YNFM family putative membrane transporter